VVGFGWIQLQVISTLVVQTPGAFERLTWINLQVMLSEFDAQAIELSNRSVSDEGAISLDNVKDYPPTLTSINDNAGVKSTFQLFPNPTAVEFTIRAKGFKGEQFNLSLMDLQGRVV
jgi:hypothetical protein